MLSFPILYPRRSRGGRLRRKAAPSPPAPSAVLLLAVHVQPDGSTLSFVFDQTIVAIDGVAAEQFECVVEGNPPLLGDSIVGFDGANLLVAFSQDVSGATVGTLVSGENIGFEGGGTAGDGQSQPVT